MNLHNNVSAKMEYIQKVFLGVQDYMQKNYELEELMIFLNAEPPEFRSVAYESASMGIALHEITTGKEITDWKNFYQCSAKAHTFHMEIGLGWAFAKTEISPTTYLESMSPEMQWMVFDGMGYYYGLFKGRRTVKNQLIPEGIKELELHGFDQGLGRRLWYIAKGDVNALVQLIKLFHISRHGVGIACGYVGGTTQPDLEKLLEYSNENKDHLRNGIVLAAISRNASESITATIESACIIICGKPLKEIIGPESGIRNKLIQNWGLSYKLNNLTEN